MSDFKKMADEMLEKAQIAAAVFQQLDQKQTDRIVEKVFHAGFNARIKLAKMAHEETGMGIWQHKVLKNVIATQLVYESIKNLKTAGVISENHLTGITEIAQPLGPIFAIVPVTNPTSTVLYKTLICLKSRNPVIFSVHRNAVNAGKEAVRICYEAALEAGAPDDCLQIVQEHSRDLTHAIMTHAKLALILATGGTGLVRAAYSSGNPAIGVGPGNVPVFIDKSADIPFAVSSVISSKTFDNGTICASEQSIIVEKKISAKVMAEFKKQGGYFLNPEEVKKLEKVAIDPSSGGMNAAIVGKPASYIADLAGIMLPENVHLMLAPLSGIGKDYPISCEILAPILGYFECDSYNDAIKTCIDLNFLGGIEHTASIYANDDKRIMEFAQIMNAGRIVVNTPSSQGAVGWTYNTLAPSLTLGCGTGGKNITTENISAQHLINIQRVARRRPNYNFHNFNLDRYYSEKFTGKNLDSAYYKNQ
ncbi:MAG: aldehyde dehydrogenase family protein [Bacteroidales bacterium]|nr:aldehyde dehydrogenase family protein [Bacteroidales bacterium]